MKPFEKAVGVATVRGTRVSRDTECMEEQCSSKGLEAIAIRTVLARSSWNQDLCAIRRHVSNCPADKAVRES